MKADPITDPDADPSGADQYGVPVEESVPGPVEAPRAAETVYTRILGTNPKADRNALFTLKKESKL